MTSHPLSRGRGSTACCPSCRNSFSGGGWRPWVVGGRHGIGVGTRRRRVRLNPRSRHRLAPTWVQLCRDTVPTLPRENLPATCHLRPPPATRNVPPPILNTPYSRIHFCTFARGAAAFALLHGIFASLRPSCPQVLVPSFQILTSPSLALRFAMAVALARGFFPSSCRTTWK
jgi:hypothetical protein